jgi:hypothetical protein
MNTGTFGVLVRPRIESLKIRTYSGERRAVLGDGAAFPHAVAPVQLDVRLGRGR